MLFQSHLCFVDVNLLLISYVSAKCIKTHPKKINKNTKNKKFPKCQRLNFLQVIYFLICYPLGAENIRLHDNLLQSHKFKR